MNQKTIIDITPNPANAIITALNALDVPWKDNDYYVPDDMDYILNHAATKVISRMTTILLDNDGVLTPTAFGLLANVIYKMYSRKWQKLYDTFNFDYNPINNYDMIEQMDETNEREYNNNNTRTDNLSTVITNDSTVENKMQGFNSSEYQPAEKQITDNDTTENNTGTQTVGVVGDDSNTRQYTLTRSGNIGVTTSQQMIESERKLWECNFVQIVYHDIDSVMTIDYYK